MKQEPDLPLDTREFVAGWKTIVEEHVVGDLADALRKLAASDSGGTDSVARHVAHALQLAASPSGGVQAALRYLGEVAGRAEQAGPS